MAGRLKHDLPRRHLAVVLLLTATLAVVAVAAFQFHQAVRSHRATVEAVLEDYARLTGREFVRQLAPALGYNGVNPSLRHFNDVPWPQLPAPITVADLRWDRLGAPSVDKTTRLSLVRFEGDSARLWSNGPHPKRLCTAYLRDLRTFDYDERWPFALHFAEDGATFLAFRRVSPQRFEGLIADIGLLTHFFDYVVGNRPLLPVTRAAAAVANDQLNLQVLAPPGVIYHHGRQDGRLAAETAFDYGFHELRVRIALSTELAPALIIGGLPQSRLAAPAGLLVVAVALVALTLVQWRREQILLVRQSDSMASISHELRTPLAQIQMFTETLLLDRVRSADEGRRALEIIHQETRRMADLVENVIRFSSSLHGLSRPRFATVDVTALMAEQIDYFGPTAGGADRFVLTLEPGLLVHGDDRFVRRMLRNLIDNALKYGPAGVPIELGAARDGHNIQLWVEDRGEGVPERERARIWRRFERLARHRNAAVAGTGIGLWLVRELAKVQNARVWVETGRHGGARFVAAFAPAPQQEAP